MSHRVLVVDDSAAVRKFVAFALRMVGCQSIEAMDGQDALEQLARNPDTDLIVTDLNMPNMDGLTLIRELKASGGYARIPVVILSSEQDEPIREISRQAGADAYLVKPLSPETLQQTVQILLGPTRKSA